ncbi:GNAT family N-acetyltransferase [Acidobacteria bacterium AB60]|nr:GNAT family N-acetyltransferase [Acidobacteria bacterium AB60]
MRAALWPDAPLEEHLREFDQLIATGMSGTLPAATFVAEQFGGVLVGFLDVGLRSHADGCDAARPVGYVEGWWVREDLRHHGIGRALLRAAEDWARSHGCREMASDALIDNQQSLAAHRALGFEIVDRCYHFRKSM